MQHAHAPKQAMPSATLLAETHAGVARLQRAKDLRPAEAFDVLLSHDLLSHDRELAALHSHVETLRAMRSTPRQTAHDMRLAALEDLAMWLERTNKPGARTLAAWTREMARELADGVTGPEPDRRSA